MEFEQIASRYSNMIHSIIHSLHIVKNQEEYYQVGLIALWEGSLLYDRKGTFVTYLYKCIKGKMLNVLRKEKDWDQRCCFVIHDHLKDLTYEEKMLEQEYVLSHFHHLTSLQKNWVVQHFCHGLSNQEIAEIENVRVDKIQSCGRLAMKKYVGIR